MATLIETSLGDALPPQPHHAITVHLPKWQSIVRFADRDPELMKQLKTMYPREYLPQSTIASAIEFLSTVEVDTPKVGLPLVSLWYLLFDLRANTILCRYDSASRCERGNVYS